MRILAVDDNKESLYLLETLLKGSGYEVVSAENGMEALKKLRTERVGLIISDILMPVMDGFQFCKEVKGKDELKNIPFIFYSATYKDERDEKLASQLGADKYILKPAEPKELINIIQGLIRDMEEGKFEPKKPTLEEEEKVLKLYSERLVNRLEKKMLDLEKEVTQRRQAEEKLQQQNEFLKNVIESLAHPFFVIDADDYTIKLMNSAAQAGSLSKKTKCYALNHKRTRPCGGAEHLCPLEEVKKTKKPVTVEHIHYMDGNPRIFEVHGYPIFDEKGNVVQMIEYSMDVTERKQTEMALKESEEKFRNLAEQLPNMIFINHKGRAVYANETCEEIMGYKREEFYSPDFDFLSLIAPESRELLTVSFSKHMKGEEVQPFEYTLITKEGNRIEVIISIRLISYGGESAILGIITDITERKKEEEKLRKSEASLAEAQRIAHLGNWDWDIEKNELRWSDEIYRIFGLKPQEFGATYEAFLNSVHPEDRKLVKKAVNVALNERKPYKIDHRLVLPNGSERTVHEQAEVFFDEAGKPIWMVGTVHDITERKQEEEELKSSEERLKTSFEFAPDAYYLNDLKGKFVDGNKASEDLTGYKRKELIGKNFLKLKLLSSDQIPKAAASLARNALGQATGPEEFTLNRKDGSRVETEIRTYPVKIKNQTLVLGIARDITARKKTEEKLKEYREHLEEQVEERTSELKETVEELGEAKQSTEAANRAKSDFLANISHELRTPLNSIIGFSEVILDGLTGRITDKQKEYVNDIFESGRHLLGLINDILDLSKVEAGKTELEVSEFSVKDLLEDSLDMFKEQAVKHNIVLKSNIPKDIGDITADKRRTKQVLFNLLSNAIKFSPAGGKVGISARRREKEVQITVWDEGIGIAKENFDKLFQPFQQLEVRLTKKSPGTGLGLNLCKNFVELQGGRIWVESKLGRGSKFRFTIPIRRV